MLRLGPSRSSRPRLGLVLPLLRSLLVRALEHTQGASDHPGSRAAVASAARARRSRPASARSATDGRRGPLRPCGSCSSELIRGHGVSSGTDLSPPRPLPEGARRPQNRTPPSPPPFPAPCFSFGLRNGPPLPTQAGPGSPDPGPAVMSSAVGAGRGPRSHTTGRRFRRTRARCPSLPASSSIQPARLIADCACRDTTST
jgi:hypothetical protein